MQCLGSERCDLTENVCQALFITIHGVLGLDEEGCELRTLSGGQTEKHTPFRTLQLAERVQTRNLGGGEGKREVRREIALTPQG